MQLPFLKLLFRVHSQIDLLSLESGLQHELECVRNTLRSFFVRVVVSPELVVKVMSREKSSYASHKCSAR